MSLSKLANINSGRPLKKESYAASPVIEPAADKEVIAKCEELLEVIRSYRERSAQKKNLDKQRYEAAERASRNARAEIKRAASEERRKARRRANQKNYRDRERAKKEAERAELQILLAELDMPCISPGLEAAETEAFKRWLETDGHRQRQYRARAADYHASRLVLLEIRLELDGADPQPAEFARRMTRVTGETWDRRKARDRLKLLLGLEDEGGPWSRQFTLDDEADLLVTAGQGG